MSHPSKHLPVRNHNRKECEIWSKLTIKTPQQWHRRRRHSTVFIVNFEYISHFSCIFILHVLL